MEVAELKVRLSRHAVLIGVEDGLFQLVWGRRGVAGALGTVQPMKLLQELTLRSSFASKKLLREPGPLVGLQRHWPMAPISFP